MSDHEATPEQAVCLPVPVIREAIQAIDAAAAVVAVAGGSGELRQRLAGTRLALADALRLATGWVESEHGGYCDRR
jgi:hypothetical protein